MSLFVVELNFVPMTLTTYTNSRYRASGSWVNSHVTSAVSTVFVSTVTAGAGN